MRKPSEKEFKANLSKVKEDHLTDLEKKKIAAFEDLIDLHCEIDGVMETIDMLSINFGFTKEELLEMSFNEKDLDAYYEEYSKTINFKTINL